MSIKDEIKAMYLDWINNFLTVKRFAERYNLTTEQAEIIIKVGRELHESSVKENKQHE
jgi:hypothetical protein